MTSLSLNEIFKFFNLEYLEVSDISLTFLSANEIGWQTLHLFLVGF